MIWIPLNVQVTWRRLASIKSCSPGTQVIPHYFGVFNFFQCDVWFLGLYVYFLVFWDESYLDPIVT